MKRVKLFGKIFFVLCKV